MTSGKSLHTFVKLISYQRKRPMTFRVEEMSSPRSGPGHVTCWPPHSLKAGTLHPSSRHRRSHWNHCQGISAVSEEALWDPRKTAFFLVSKHFLHSLPKFIWNSVMDQPALGFLWSLRCPFITSGTISFYFSKI